MSSWWDAQDAENPLFSTISTELSYMEFQPTIAMKRKMKIPLQNINLNSKLCMFQESSIPSKWRLTVGQVLSLYSQISLIRETTTWWTLQGISIKDDTMQ